MRLMLLFQGHDFVLQERDSKGAYNIIRSNQESSGLGLGDRKESMFSLRGGALISFFY